MPEPVVISCPECRFPFLAVNATLAETCGPTCRRRRFRRRQRAARITPAAAFFEPPLA